MNEYMPGEVLAMAISPESIEPTEHATPQTPRMSTPRQYAVSIIGWTYHDYRGRRDVLFEVRDDDGVRHPLRFGLSDLELASGQLRSFISTVLQQQLVEPEGIPPHMVRHMRFNHLVGRRVLLHVVTTSRGVQIVVDWEALPRE